MKAGSSGARGGIHRVCPALPCPALEKGQEQGTGQHKFSPFTNILWARVEGSQGRKKGRKGEKCVESWIEGQAHLNCSSLLGHLVGQVFSLEVRSQS